MNDNRPSILITIPTCLRPRMLARCLESMAVMELPPTAAVSLLVADNDAKESARTTVARFAKVAPFPVAYTVAVDRGLCRIRNHIFDYAAEHRADYIATCDDDNVVTPNWLNELYGVLTEQQTDTCSGVVIEAPNGIPAKRAKRAQPPGNIKWEKSHSTSNLLISSKIYEKLGLRFDLRFNFSGAEDIELFDRAYQAGARLIRNRNAVVYHITNESRQSMKYRIARIYSGYVQSTYISRLRNKKSVAAILLSALSNLIGGIITLPLCPFHVAMRKRCLKSWIKPVAYIRGLFGCGRSKTYIDIAEDKYCPLILDPDARHAPGGGK
ncbi:glycosyltransferase family 2 protein [Candidatus Spongiihabitans sp.]|uniref:glycosyltransferase family 2 protein n=1 Tax=Candidatus Spongiihabitans sp. TaxID=3101308 RepID=UPI003C7B0DEF